MELTKLVLENKTMSDDNPKKTITQKFERPNTRKIRAPRIGLSRRIPSFKYMNKRKMPKKAFRVQQPHRTNKNNQLEQPEKKEQRRKTHCKTVWIYTNEWDQSIGN